MKKTVSLLSLASIVVCSFWLAGAARRDDEALDPPPQSFTLNALDYRLNIFDLRHGKLGTSRHLSDVERLYVGDLYFTGEQLVVLENDRYTGHFVDLGEEKKPDNEFALFHSLRIYKRAFQVREFPFLDKHSPYPGIEPGRFFNNPRDPVTVARLEVNRLYLLRLYHRTTVRDERVFLLRVIDYTPGVKVTALWRELEVSSEP
jgi:hypothetical protein